MKAAIICSAVIIILCPGANGRSTLRCGDEFQIETRDGITIRGRLKSNDGNILVFRDGKIFQDKFKPDDSNIIVSPKGKIYQVKPKKKYGEKSVFLIKRYEKFELHTIKLEDISSASPITRRAGKGVLVGAGVGTVVGLCVAIVVNQKKGCTPEREAPLACLGDMSKDMARFGIITGSGIVVGGIIGGIIGQNCRKLNPVKLEALPMCTSPSGDKIPFKMNLVINF